MQTEFSDDFFAGVLRVLSVSGIIKYSGLEKLFELCCEKTVTTMMKQTRL